MKMPVILIEIVKKQLDTRSLLIISIYMTLYFDSIFVPLYFYELYLIMIALTCLYALYQIKAIEERERAK